MKLNKNILDSIAQFENHILMKIKGITLMKDWSS